MDKQTDKQTYIQKLQKYGERQIAEKQKHRFRKIERYIENGNM